MTLLFATVSCPPRMNTVPPLFPLAVALVVTVAPPDSVIPPKLVKPAVDDGLMSPTLISPPAVGF